MSLVKLLLSSWIKKIHQIIPSSLPGTFFQDIWPLLWYFFKVKSLWYVATDHILGVLIKISKFLQECEQKFCYSISYALYGKIFSILTNLKFFIALHNLSPHDLSYDFEKLWLRVTWKYEKGNEMEVNQLFFSWCPPVKFWPNNFVKQNLTRAADFS